MRMAAHFPFPNTFRDLSAQPNSRALGSSRSRCSCRAASSRFSPASINSAMMANASAVVLGCTKLPVSVLTAQYRQAAISRVNGTFSAFINRRTTQPAAAAFSSTTLYWAYPGLPP